MFTIFVGTKFRLPLASVLFHYLYQCFDMSSFGEAVDTEPDPQQYTEYLKDALAQSDNLSNLIQAGCITIGNDPDGHPAILLVPHLGLPKVYLEGETEVEMLRKYSLILFASIP